MKDDEVHTVNHNGSIDIRHQVLPTGADDLAF